MCVLKCPYLIYFLPLGEHLLSKATTNSSLALFLDSKPFMLTNEPE